MDANELERIKAKDGTADHEFKYAFGGMFYRNQEELDDDMQYASKRVQKKHGTWRPTHREDWTWKFGYDRQGFPTIWRTQSSVTNLETGEVQNW